MDESQGLYGAFDQSDESLPASQEPPVPRRSSIRPMERKSSVGHPRRISWAPTTHFKQIQDDGKTAVFGVEEIKNISVENAADKKHQEADIGDKENQQETQSVPARQAKDKYLSTLLARYYKPSDIDDCVTIMRTAMNQLSNLEPQEGFCKFLDIIKGCPILSENGQVLKSFLKEFLDLPHFSAHYAPLLESHNFNIDEIAPEKLLESTQCFFNSTKVINSTVMLGDTTNSSFRNCEITPITIDQHELPATPSPVQDTKPIEECSMDICSGSPDTLKDGDTLHLPAEEPTKIAQTMNCSVEMPAKTDDSLNFSVEKTAQDTKPIEECSMDICSESTDTLKDCDTLNFSTEEPTKIAQTMNLSGEMPAKTQHSLNSSVEKTAQVTKPIEECSMDICSESTDTLKDCDTLNFSTKEPTKITQTMNLSVEMPAKTDSSLNFSVEKTTQDVSLLGTQQMSVATDKTKDKENCSVAEPSKIATKTDNSVSFSVEKTTQDLSLFGTQPIKADKDKATDEAVTKIAQIANLSVGMAAKTNDSLNLSIEKTAQDISLFGTEQINVDKDKMDKENCESPKMGIEPDLQTDMMDSFSVFHCTDTLISEPSVAIKNRTEKSFFIPDTQAFSMVSDSSVVNKDRTEKSFLIPDTQIMSIVSETSAVHNRTEKSFFIPDTQAMSIMSEASGCRKDADNKQDKMESCMEKSLDLMDGFAKTTVYMDIDELTNVSHKVDNDNGDKTTDKKGKIDTSVAMDNSLDLIGRLGKTTVYMDIDDLMDHSDKRTDKVDDSLAKMMMCTEAKANDEDEQMNEKDSLLDELNGSEKNAANESCSQPKTNVEVFEYSVEDFDDSMDLHTKPKYEPTRPLMNKPMACTDTLEFSLEDANMDSFKTDQKDNEDKKNDKSLTDGEKVEDIGAKNDINQDKSVCSDENAKAIEKQGKKDEISACIDDKLGQIVHNEDKNDEKIDENVMESSCSTLKRTHDDVEVGEDDEERGANTNKMLVTEDSLCRAMLSSLEKTSEGENAPFPKFCMNDIKNANKQGNQTTTKVTAILQPLFHRKSMFSTMPSKSVKTAVTTSIANPKMNKTVNICQNQSATEIDFNRTNDKLQNLSKKETSMVDSSVKKTVEPAKSFSSNFLRKSLGIGFADKLMKKVQSVPTVESRKSIDVGRENVLEESKNWLEESVLRNEFAHTSGRSILLRSARKSVIDEHCGVKNVAEQSKSFAEESLKIQSKSVEKSMEKSMDFAEELSKSKSSTIIADGTISDIENADSESMTEDSTIDSKMNIDQTMAEMSEFFHSIDVADPECEDDDILKTNLTKQFQDSSSENRERDEEDAGISKDFQTREEDSEYDSQELTLVSHSRIFEQTIQNLTALNDTEDFGESTEKLWNFTISPDTRVLEELQKEDEVCYLKIEDVKDLNLRIQEINHSHCELRLVWGTFYIDIVFGDVVDQGHRSMSMNTHSLAYEKRLECFDAMFGKTPEHRPKFFNDISLGKIYRDEHFPLLEMAHDYLRTRIHERFEKLTKEFDHTGKLLGMVRELCKLGDEACKLYLEVRDLYTTNFDFTYLGRNSDDKFCFVKKVAGFDGTHFIDVVIAFDFHKYPDQVIHPEIIVPDEYKQFYLIEKVFKPLLKRVTHGKDKYLTELIRSTEAMVRAVTMVVNEERRMQRQRADLCSNAEKIPRSP